jgi:hypothetical protein
MASWSCLTNHASTLLCIAHDPGVRVHEIAVEVDTTERSAHGIVADLVDAGYLVKQRTGRRNRYRIQAHLPLRDSVTRERTIGEMLDLLVGTKPGSREHRQAGFTMPDSPRSKSAAHGRVSGHPHRPRHLLSSAVSVGVISASHHRALAGPLVPGGCGGGRQLARRTTCRMASPPGGGRAPRPWAIRADQRRM